MRHRRRDDGTHEVELAIRVWLYMDSGMWVAQGLDLDYMASGTSPDDVKDRFARGLLDMIEAHLAEFGSIEALAKQAPPEVFQSYWAAVTAAHGQTPERRPLPAARSARPTIPAAIEFWKTPGSPAPCHP